MNSNIKKSYNIKKCASLIMVAVILILALFSGCGSTGESGLPESQEEPNAQDNTTENPEGSVPEEPQGEAQDSEQGAALNDEAPIVYMTADISSEGLMAVYEALGRKASGNVAVKINTGEPGGTNFLSPDLIKELVQSVNGTIVECNTAYGGNRANTAMHYQVAEDHGFTAIAPVVIMDEDGHMSLPVVNGKHLEEDLVGAHFADYDFHMVLSHFKGHEMAGFGGAIKNLSIGYASSTGKSLIHSAGKRTTGIGPGTPKDHFQESMAEAAKAVADSAGDNILYINVMNNLSIDCDCNSRPAEPAIEDIGILASLDPVALDKACVDLIYDAPDNRIMIIRIESMKGVHALEYGEQIGLGSMEYKLVSVDD